MNGQSSHTRLPFLLHTYLVEAIEIKNSVCYDSSPALHIAATRVIGYVSASPSAKFLLAALRIGRFLFIIMVASCGLLKKSYTFHCYSISAVYRDRCCGQCHRAHWCRDILLSLSLLVEHLYLCASRCRTYEYGFPLGAAKSGLELQF